MSKVQTQIEIVSNGDEQQLDGASSLEKIMSQQLLLMSRQLEMLREQHHSPVPAPVMKTAPVAAVAVPTPEKKPNLNPAPNVPDQPIKQVSSTSAPTTSTGPQFSGKESSSVNGHRSYSIPVTEAQRQVWITSQMGESASSAYNESITLYMRGQLDLPALKRALQQLVDRHESLRVTFSPEGDRQWVSPHVAMELPYADFSSLDQTQRDAAITEWIASEVRQTFDLAKGPLFRGRIAKAEEQYHLLILTHHHLVADGESGATLMRDLRALYAAEHLGAACELPAPKTFSEYVQRQTSERSEVETSEAEAYWLDQFADAVPILELPTDRPRPLVQTYHGAPRILTVDPELYHELKRVGTQNNATFLMTLFAVSNILLHRLSGQDDIVVGSPAAGQVAAGVKEAVGYCINMLPVRSRWAANPTFVEYLRTVRRSLLNGYDHQNYSPGRLIEKLNLIWDPSRSPLFSVTFNFDKSGSGMLMDDLHVQVVQNAGSSVRFDLCLIFTEIDNELRFECRYNTDLFDSRTIDRWMQCCLTLMRSIVSNPQQGVRDLSLLSDAEKEELLTGWQNCHHDSFSGRSIRELFATQFEAAPNTAGETVSSSENIRVYILDRRANPVPIGVWDELYLGGSFFQGFDLNLPEFMAEKLIPDPFSSTGGTYLYRTGDEARYLEGGEIELRSSEDRERKVGELLAKAEEVAAVLNQHPAVRESAVTVSEEFAGSYRMVAYIVPEYRQAQAVSDSHRLYRLPNGLEVAQLNKNETDYMYQEIFRDEIYLQNGISLSDGATVFDVGANIGMFALFVQQRWPNSRVYAFEPLPPIFEVLRANVALYGLDVKLFNCGLSNRTTQTQFTFYPKMSLMSGAYGDAQEEESVTRAYINRVFAGEVSDTDDILQGFYETQACVCDVRTLSHVIREERIERIDLLKIDVEKSELDVLQGIADADWTKIKQLVIEVYDKDGRLGKIKELLEEHGYRVQIKQEESLEATGLYNVYAFSSIREETNASSEAETTQARTGLTSRNITFNELHTYLQERLPEHLIPTTFIAVEELMPGYEVSQRALPGAKLTGRQLQESYVAPRDETEKALAEIWAEVLRLERVGVENKFFDLGGHSLVALQIIARVRSTFQVQLTMRHIFEAPTVAQLAAEIKNIQLIGGTQEDTSIDSFIAQDEERLLEDIDQLSDQQVDSLLNDLLREEEIKNG